MNETQLILSQILTQINTIQEVIAKEEVKYYGSSEWERPQKEGGLWMMDQAKLEDFHFR